MRYAAARWLLTRLPPHPAGSGLVLVLPFAAYAAADFGHGSGVLAVVTVALALSRYGDTQSSQTRLVSGTTWEIVELLLTGAAFAFVGLELRNVAGSLSGSLDTAIWQALAVTAAAIVIRFVWIIPVTYLDEKLRLRKGIEGEPVGWREMTVASWAGMRGVVTLAAVLALPAGEEAFPERDRLIFIAFVVIVVTIVLQGLTLPLVVKRLGVMASVDQNDEAERDLIRRARDAGLRRLEDLRTDREVDAKTITHAEDNAERMWHSLGFDPGEHSDAESERNAKHAATLNVVKDEILAAARNEIGSARRESGVDPAIVDGVLRRLDARGTQPE